MNPLSRAMDALADIVVDVWRRDMFAMWKVIVVTRGSLCAPATPEPCGGLTRH
jgi:hypothetical protein